MVLNCKIKISFLLFLKKYFPLNICTQDSARALWLLAIFVLQVHQNGTANVQTRPAWSCCSPETSWCRGFAGARRRTPACVPASRRRGGLSSSRGSRSPRSLHSPPARSSSHDVGQLSKNDQLVGSESIMRDIYLAFLLLQWILISFQTKW